MEETENRYQRAKTNVKVTKIEHAIAKLLFIKDAGDNFKCSFEKASEISIKFATKKTRELNAELVQLRHSKDKAQKEYEHYFREHICDMEMGRIRDIIHRERAELAARMELAENNQA